MMLPEVIWTVLLPEVLKYYKTIIRKFLVNNYFKSTHLIVDYCKSFFVHNLQSKVRLFLSYFL